jgi:hypothetical protein
VPYDEPGVPGVSDPWGPPQGAPLEYAPALEDDRDAELELLDRADFGPDDIPVEGPITEPSVLVAPVDLAIPPAVERSESAPGGSALGGRSVDGAWGGSHGGVDLSAAAPGTIEAIVPSAAWEFAPAPALLVAHRKRRRMSPIVATTIALGVLTTVGGVAAVRTVAKDRATSTKSTSTVAAVGSTKGTTSAASGSGATTSVEATTTTAATLPPTTLPPIPAMAKPLPAGGLYEGGRPPQFVLVSFDGAADQSILEHWETVSAKVKAHMSFFLSTVYMLSKDERTKYQGPHHNPGESNIGFSQNGDVPVADWMRTTVTGLQDAQRKGHELGMHFGGHWCGVNGVRAWNAADWNLDLDQSDALAANVDANNHLTPPVGSPFLTKPVGARTPCLEGNLSLLEPVLAERGYRYDASKSRNLNEWPRNANGLWQYGFPSIAIQGYKIALLAVDYSINYNMVANHGEADAQRAKQIEPLVYDGYMGAFNQLYYGNRAPFELSNHFTHMSHDAYNNAVEKFLTTVCTKPEVHCVSYREATDWMDAHKDAVDAFEKGTFPVLAKPAA